MNSEDRQDEFPIPSTETKGPQDSTREELLSLSEAGEIRYTTKYLKKASQETLAKIKKDYDRKPFDVTNEFITDNLISKFSDLMKNLDMVENPDEMEEELTGNQMLKKDLKLIVGCITPYLPYTGLFCGGVVVAKHVVNKRYNGKETQQDENKQGD